MPNYRLQAIMKTADNVNENFETNTLYFTADNDGVLPTISSIVAPLYQTLDTFWSNQLGSTNALEQRFYDMGDPEPRTPVYTSFSNLSGAGAAPLPNEVALVLSFHADFESGVPPARRRGRIYFGFWGENNNDPTGRPDSFVVDAVKEFGQNLLDASVAATTWKWVQHSTVDNSFNIVAGGFVDNEWDTQRRRGRRRTSRVTFAP